MAREDARKKTIKGKPQPDRDVTPRRKLPKGYKLEPIPPAEVKPYRNKVLKV
jgi:hypothetical protein